MDKTMMRRFGQLQRLTANHPIDDLLTSDSKRPGSLFTGKRIVLRDEDYDRLLAEMRLTSPHVRHHRHLPHPPNSQVLRPQVVTKSSWKVSEHVSVSVLKPNNVIKYRKDGKSHYAMIRQIYIIQNPTGGHEARFLANPIEDIFFKDRTSPSKHFRYIVHLLKCVIGQTKDTAIFISPAQVSVVAAYRLLPNNTFGIAEGGIVLRPCDKRSQYADL
ncbi:uncharacterized protein MELLADRAFT_65468 [Melampsora larici-populina 98AG31]|uniref:Uncharacterized protein n=1 Tax=Melampsora larici-populina (strain 98AG31 / pathotype 3-4-7) TaxID=747676 RepID=F4RVG7_MELLP|nr:uncharacterized protein MELLADRAFT_65468 [Melampsora larici-populina 98AG31]EGG03620.1 hypothetical protein MELLADRAFT_65468 [Melampsora larici-populina 98AG31]